MSWMNILKSPIWYMGSNPYKPRKDKRFQYLSDLTPEWDDKLTWESKDKKARGEAVYQEPYGYPKGHPDYSDKYYWDIHVFTIKDNIQNKGKAREYLKEFIEELHSLEDTNALPTVSKIQPHTSGFWEKMKLEGLIQ